MGRRLLNCKSIEFPNRKSTCVRKSYSTIRRFVPFHIALARSGFLRSGTPIFDRANAAVRILGPIPQMLAPNEVRL